MRMVQLRMHLTGEAERAISGLGSGGVMYPTALKTIKEHYGQPRSIGRSFIQKLTRGDKIRTSDRQMLRMFSIDIRNCIATFKRINFLADINSSETLRQVVRRFPDYMVVKWKSAAANIRENGYSPTIEDISDFVQKCVKAEFDPDFGDIERGHKSDTRELRRERVPYEVRRGIHAAQSPSQQFRRFLKCYVCSGEHRVGECETFSRKSLSEKEYIIRQNGLCFACLGKGHNSRNCHFRKACGRNGCTRTHHPFLHVEPHVASGAGSPSERACIMPVVRVLFRGPSGRVREGNVLIDSGAGVTIHVIRKEFSEALALQGKKENLELSVVGGKTLLEKDSRKVTFYISPLEGGEEFCVEAHEINKTVLNAPAIDKAWLSSFSHLCDIDFPYKEGPVDLILGVQYSHLHADQEIRESVAFEPVGKRTRLGWLVIGCDRKKKNFNSVLSAVTVLHKVDIGHLYDMETIGVKAPSCTCPKKVMSPDDIKVLNMFESSCKKEGNRFEIGVPWKKAPSLLVDNFSLAEKRLYSLEHNLQKDVKKTEMYSKDMSDYIENEWAAKLDLQEEVETVYYLPHHGVYRLDKASTPLRVVFDPACKFQGVSLNSFLYKGPSTIGDLFGTLLRFREDRIAFMGNISKMYLQIKLPEKDTHAHRFLLKSMDLTRDPTVYRLLRVTFGDNPSPDMASFVILKIAEVHQAEYPDAAVILQRDRYMDDLIHSCESSDTAVTRMKDLETVSATGSFKIKEWYCSSQQVRAELTGADAQHLKEVPSIQEDNQVKTLGVVWNCNSDKIGFKVQGLSSKQCSKRSILSRLSMLYDPLRLASVVTIRARVSLQDIWRCQIGWDDPLSETMCKLWHDMFQDWDKLNQLELDRCLKPDNACGNSELHVFVDASITSYGACAYMLWPTPDGPSVRLVAAKARVAPLRQTTIPRLELLAALIGSRLSRTIYDDLKSKPEVFLWSDSQIVFQWLRSESKAKKPFVGVRIAEIQSEWSSLRWMSVPTKLNPADHLSRGVKVNDIPYTWFNGPSFLKLEKSLWPEQVVSDQNDSSEDKKISMCAGVQPQSMKPSIDLERFSSWGKLVRVTAYCFRFIQTLKDRVRKVKRTKELVLEPEEIEKSEKYWIREAQKEVPDVKTTCAELSPFIEDGLARVGGILLPSSNCISKLIMRDIHMRTGRGGIERTLSECRRSYHRLTKPLKGMTLRQMKRLDW